MRSAQINAVWEAQNPSMASQWSKPTTVLQIYFSDRRSNLQGLISFCMGLMSIGEISVISRCGSVWPFLARWLEIPPEELTCFVETGSRMISVGTTSWRMGAPIVSRSYVNHVVSIYTVQRVRHFALSASSCFSFALLDVAVLPLWSSLHLQNCFH